MNKKDKLNALINDLPMCDRGQAQIRALVAEITGENLTEASPIREYYRIGDRFRDDGGREYILAHTLPFEITVINLSSGCRRNPSVSVICPNHITEHELLAAFAIERREQLTKLSVSNYE